MLPTGNDPVFLHYQCSVMPLYYESLERDTRIELVTKPWQGLVLPLAPIPQLTWNNLWYVRNCSWTAVELFKKFFSLLRSIRIDSFLFFTLRCSNSGFVHWHTVIYTKFSVCSVVTISLDRLISVRTLDSRISSCSFCFRRLKSATIFLKP